MLLVHDGALVPVVGQVVGQGFKAPTGYVVLLMGHRKIVRRTSTYLQLESKSKQGSLALIVLYLSCLAITTVKVSLISA